MRIKSAITAFTILLSTAISTPLEAQNGSQTTNSTNAVDQNNGFRIGTIQNPTGTPQSATTIQHPGNPVMGISNPVQGMTNPPILQLGGGIAQQQNPPVTARGQNGAAVLAPGATIFVPPGTLVIENNDPFIPGSILSAPVQSQNSQQGQRGRNTSKPETAAAAVPTTNALALGTPRDKVIEKYGNPVAFMMGMNGETLYFSNGVVVFVKDGVVATPGK